MILPVRPVYSKVSYSPSFPSWPPLSLVLFVAFPSQKLPPVPEKGHLREWQHGVRDSGNGDDKVKGKAVGRGIRLHKWGSHTMSIGRSCSSRVFLLVVRD